MSNEDAEARFQFGTAAIISYVVEMGADPKLMELASSYDKHDIRYLSASEMAELRVTNAAANQPQADALQVSTTPDPASVSAPAPTPGNSRKALRSPSSGISSSIMAITTISLLLRLGRPTLPRSTIMAS
ncbi:hypothetical protein A9K71_05570 [Mesorhizobium sp. WSM3873]|nr:hypothetical protein A9K71_05570 [Mesorhizobium sp. WSM3873]